MALARPVPDPAADSRESLIAAGSVYRKNLISYLKNEEIRGKRLGRL
jgi:hypothetical protein